MSWMKLPFSAGGQFVSATALVSIFAAGCGGVGSASGDLIGTIINTDTSKDLIGGVRLRSEEAAYAFGAFQPDGQVADISAVVLRDRDGRIATLHLEAGRPSRAIGFDGSRLDIVYEQVTAARLSGHVTFTPAGGQPQTYMFDVDLEKTARQIAELVEETLGVVITSDPPPPNARGTDKSAEGRSSALAAGGTAVQGAVVFAIPVLLVITGFTIHLVLGQIIQAMIDLADAVAKSFLVAALTPFVVMGNLLRLAAGQPLITLEYNELAIGDGDVVLTIPRPQPF